MLSRRLILGGGAALAATGCDRAVDAQTRATQRVELAVDHIGQEAMMAVPTAASMILHYYGDPRPPRELKSLAAGKTYDEALPFNDFTVTLYDDLLRGMDRLGYGWTERRYPATAQGLDQGLRAITESLADGRPVLADVSVPEGHAFVIRGFDAGSRELHIVDPKAPAPGRFTLTYPAFGEVWNESAYGRSGRYLILTRPRTA
ncbi:C39 family peptidase [Brevundimonas sp. NIBR11]|uniref:C39 family peptidase n=1 Tax=Brevundimonas sp. NIBR11 TaxID=3015999 RepID=UPI0022F06BAE|nr:C39 family peptidase [Brevundimonas sp. NIBR11]WGM32219.1 hypothetical protein KKHFBJBL_02470 [Brevundimonas sp. NIBR11]